MITFSTFKQVSLEVWQESINLYHIFSLEKISSSPNTKVYTNNVKQAFREAKRPINVRAECAILNCHLALKTLHSRTIGRRHFKKDESDLIV